MDTIYYENVDISYKTINIFETMYLKKKEEIIYEIKKNIKEKYNIDINTDGRKSTKTTKNHTTTYAPYNTTNDATGHTGSRTDCRQY